MVSICFDSMHEVGNRLRAFGNSLKVDLELFDVAMGGTSKSASKGIPKVFGGFCERDGGNESLFQGANKGTKEKAILPNPRLVSGVGNGSVVFGNSRRW